MKAAFLPIKKKKIKFPLRGHKHNSTKGKRQMTDDACCGKSYSVYEYKLVISKKDFLFATDFKATGNQCDS